MGGVYGVEESKRLVGAVAEVANVVSKVLNKAGFFALFGIAEPLDRLKNVDFEALKKELSVYDEADRAAVEAEFAAKFKPVKPDVEAKVEGVASLLNESIGLVSEAVAVFNKGLSVVERAKALFAPAPAVVHPVES